jgi:hypothetical protein
MTLNAMARKGFNGDHIAIFEMPHMELTQGGAFQGSMRTTVDHRAAHAANAFAAVVVKSDGLLAGQRELFVDHIEHFQKGHIGGDIADAMGFKMPFLLGSVLTPDFEGEIEVRAHL